MNAHFTILGLITGPKICIEQAPDDTSGRPMPRPRVKLRSTDAPQPIEWNRFRKLGGGGGGGRKVWRGGGVGATAEEFLL